MRSRAGNARRALSAAAALALAGGALALAIACAGREQGASADAGHDAAEAGPAAPACFFFVPHCLCGDPSCVDAGDGGGGVWTCPVCPVAPED